MSGTRAGMRLVACFAASFLVTALTILPVSSAGISQWAEGRHDHGTPGVDSVNHDLLNKIEFTSACIMEDCVSNRQAQSGMRSYGDLADGGSFWAAVGYTSVTIGGGTIVQMKFVFIRDSSPAGPNCSLGSHPGGTGIFGSSGMPSGTLPNQFIFSEWGVNPNQTIKDPSCNPTTSPTGGFAALKAFIGTEDLSSSPLLATHIFKDFSVQVLHGARFTFGNIWSKDDKPKIDIHFIGSRSRAISFQPPPPPWPFWAFTGHSSNSQMHAYKADPNSNFSFGACGNDQFTSQPCPP